MQIMKHWTAPLHSHTRLGNCKRPVETFLETRIRNDHRLIWMIFFVSIESFNVFDNFHSLQNFSKTRVLAIQPRRPNSCDVKLWAVGVFAGVRHTHPTRPIMLQDKILVIKVLAIDALRSRSVSVGEVSSWVTVATILIQNKVRVNNNL